MSKIRYCSLEEAWGEIPTPINTSENLIKTMDKKLPPIDINYNCQKESLTNHQRPQQLDEQTKQIQHLPQVSQTKELSMRNNLDEPSKNLLNTMDHLQVKYGMTKNDYNTLLEKFSNVMNSVNTVSVTKEDFSNQYAPYQNNQNNQSYDILFLILLGLFIIYVLDKR